IDGGSDCEMLFLAIENPLRNQQCVPSNTEKSHTWNKPWETENIIKKNAEKFNKQLPLSRRGHHGDQVELEETKKRYFGS
ncbi:Hypothetical protein FKW44_006897, partial [Caligus rogercresseyi]